MHTKLLVSLPIVALSSLLGCEARPVEDLPQSPKPGVSLIVPPASVTTPSSDVSLPPVGTAALREDDGPTGATTGSALTRNVLNTQMPLPGQGNDHSTPGRAKQRQAPVTSAK